MTGTNKLFGAILLIAGTSIGAGMLALPVITAQFGFLAAITLFILCWAITTYAAFLMLEANLWLPPGANIISMTKETLGKSGEIIASLAYLFLLYCLMAAYLSGMNSLITTSSEKVVGFALPSWGTTLFLVSIFGIVVTLGTKLIDYLNRFLILGFVISYFGLLGISVPNIHIEQLYHTNFIGMWLALPVLVTAFGYQIIIPSLRLYLNSDVKMLVKAILIGSFIPLIVYILWELVILGIIPLNGELSLTSILHTSSPEIGCTKALEKILNNHLIGSLSSALVFFVISTSFIGVSLSLFDFIADGLHLTRSTFHRLLIAIVAFTPPYIFTLTSSHAFISALGYGGIFVAILLILLPVTMVMRGRYVKTKKSALTTPGGKIGLLMAILFSLCVIVAQIATSILQHT
ncbi:MAG: tyrosine transporter [Gammaproteobacteria bacterium]|nr:tyrosine transporter [Gammaproteobacteria bacterium]